MFTVKPTSLNISPGSYPVSADRKHEMACEVLGSHPPPEITWWLGDIELTEFSQKVLYKYMCVYIHINNSEFQTILRYVLVFCVSAAIFNFRKASTYTRSRFYEVSYLYFQDSEDGNVTISTLNFTPKREDNGRMLTCRARNVHVDGEHIETAIQLDVHCESFSYKMFQNDLHIHIGRTLKDFITYQNIFQITSIFYYYGQGFRFFLSVGNSLKFLIFINNVFKLLINSISI